MDPRERFSDSEEALRAAISGVLAGLWTALPCTVSKVNLAEQTVELQPTIMAKVRKEDGTLQDVRLPVLPDVPIMFMGGGGFTATFPIAVGDEALAVFSSRCIDSWWQSGGVQTQAEVRMHDLSDAFAIIGPRSKPRALAGISATTAQLRSDDGETFVEVGAGIINVTAPTAINLTAPDITLNATNKIMLNGGTEVEADTPLFHVTGVIQVDNEDGASSAGSMSGDLHITNGDVIVTTGNVTVTGGDVSADTINLKTHRHTGVTTGAGTSGTPVP